MAGWRLGVLHAQAGWFAYVIDEGALIAWSGTAWVNNTRSSLTFDANNNWTSELRETWSGTSWVNNTRSSFTYDANNKVTSQLDETWNGTVWVNSDSTHYYYPCNITCIPTSSTSSTSICPPSGTSSGRPSGWKRCCERQCRRSRWRASVQTGLMCPEFIFVGLRRCRLRLRTCRRAQDRFGRSEKSRFSGA